MALFKRQSRADGGTRKQALAALGISSVALRLAEGDLRHLPPAGMVVVVDGAGRTRRISTAFSEKSAWPGGADDSVFCFHPGPYSVALTPFAAAPELGLHLQFAIDAANPRVDQQRFDLYLASEVAGELTLAQLVSSLQTVVQSALVQGNLDLPPCTTHDEWDGFRLGLNELLYTRFGVTVDDCLPVDLGDHIDFAAMLAAREEFVAPLVPPPATPETEVTVPQAESPAGAAQRDAAALRRLFLELPAVTSGVRLLALPAGLPLFQAHQQLLQRYDLATLAVSTMPSLAWATPDAQVPAIQQARRASASEAAVAALDESWATLATLRLAAPAQLPALFDDVDRLLANMELALEQRRATDLPIPLPVASAVTLAEHERREPT